MGRGGGGAALRWPDETEPWSLGYLHETHVGWQWLDVVQLSVPKKRGSLLGAVARGRADGSSKALPVIF